MSTLVLATSNLGKIREFDSLLAPLGWQVKPQGDWGLVTPEETGLTFVENALLKARYAAQHTGLAAIAEDAGLVVPALDGAPGLYSSRFAGETATDGQNIQLLMQKMQGLSQRQAYFISVIVFLRHAHDPDPILAQGRWHGEILSQPQGDGGFGYDPVFAVPGLAKSAAQLDKGQKNTLSHRAQAVQHLLQQLG